MARDTFLCVGDGMTEIIVDLGPVNKVNETAFEQAIERLAKWHDARISKAVVERDAPDLMIKTVCAPCGTLRKSVIFQRQEWASAFMGFFERECAAG